jgi:FkbM family methyltransferase
MKPMPFITAQTPTGTFQDGWKLRLRLHALRILEHGAQLLRRCRLGWIVDRVGATMHGPAAAVSLEIDGLRLGVDHPGHLFYLRKIIEGREAYLIELLEQLTPRGGFAVEGGAHIGYMSLHIARSLGADGELLIFEPNPEIQSILRTNLALNGFEQQVVIEQQAIGSREERAAFFLAGSGDPSSLVDVGNSRAQIQVNVTTLDVALSNRTAVPDVIKLDIEGFECAALQGARHLANADRNAPALFLECNPRLLSAAGASEDGLCALLADLGFAAWIIDERQRQLVPFDPGMPRDTPVVNLLCLRRAIAATMELSR